MKYIQPFDHPSDATAPYVDLNAGAGIDGSVPPAAFFNTIQGELINLITGAGLTPSATDLHQVLGAVRALIPPPPDAPLVHYAADTGMTNALKFVPMPAVASVSAGFMLLGVAAHAATDACTVTISLTPDTSVTFPLVKDDGSAVAANDIIAGRIVLIVCDGQKFRLAWVHRGVQTDGVTVGGDGRATPLYALPQTVKSDGVTIRGDGRAAPLSVINPLPDREGTGIGAIYETFYGSTPLYLSPTSTYATAEQLINGLGYGHYPSNNSSSGIFDARAWSLTGLFILRSVGLESVTTVFGVGWFYKLKWERVA